MVVHLWLMVDRGFDRGCFGFSAPTAVVECEAVIQSDAGSLFGISNAVWGLLFYLGVAGLSALVAFSTGFGATARRLRHALIGIGFAYSAYLVYVQATQIGQWCKLCLISAGIVTVLTLLTSWQLFSKQPDA